MSSFYCDKCGALCSDTDRGYVTGCKHYPPDKAAVEYEKRAQRRVESLLNLPADQTTLPELPSKSIYHKSINSGFDSLDAIEQEIINDLSNETNNSAALKR